MKASLALLLVAGAALASTGVGSTSQPPLLAAVGKGPATRLTAVNPLTLAFVGKSTQIGRYIWPAAYSPERSRIVLAGTTPASLRFVDLRTMKTMRAVRVGSTGVQAVAWPAARTVLAAVDPYAVVAVDPSTGRPLWRKLMPGEPEVFEVTAKGLVALIPPAGEIGATTLLTVDATGAFRSVVLDQVRSGGRQSDGDQSVFAVRYAGLALDRAANRAYVVGADEPVAEVDLTTMTVTYHGGSRTLAKAVTGPEREAHWLGNGLIALTGSDRNGADEATDAGQHGDPAGLVLIDTRDWSRQRVDSDTEHLVVANGAILATGAAGLTAYALDGTRSFHLFDRRISIQAGAGMAYVWVPTNGADKQSPAGISVVDVASGRVVGTLPNRQILLLAGL